MTRPPPIHTPDGRYIVVDEVLWRATRPDLSDTERQSLVDALMTGRRGVAAANRASDDAALKAARAQVNAAKIGLGERGPVWWDDGSPDLNRHKVANTPYAEWWSSRDG